MLLSLGGACFVGLGGLIGLIVFLVFVAKGKVRSGLECGTGNGGVYGETFALWLAVFTGLSAAAALLPEDWPKLPLAGAAMLLSLVVLGWPVLRGVPWQRVREDVGLTWGRKPAVEPLVGIGTYAMALPLLAVGLLLTFLLTLLERNLMGGNGEVSFAPGGGPAHPIIDDVARGGLGERLVLLVLACLVAPLVEETMFRGVLYRHLREATCRWGAWSFLCSAAVGSFLFAVIHPQGLVAVPVLMALAFGFAIAREWRGTLVPAMVAHGLNNGLVMVVTLLAFGD
jgi:membrane protease YdiL (CAAX protease family)